MNCLAHRGLLSTYLPLLKFRTVCAVNFRKLVLIHLHDPRPLYFPSLFSSLSALDSWSSCLNERMLRDRNGQFSKLREVRENEAKNDQVDRGKGGEGRAYGKGTREELVKKDEGRDKHVIRIRDLSSTV